MAPWFFSVPPGKREWGSGGTHRRSRAAHRKVAGLYQRIRKVDHPEKKSEAAHRKVAGLYSRAEAAPLLWIPRGILLDKCTLSSLSCKLSPALRVRAEGRLYFSARGRNDQQPRRKTICCAASASPGAGAKTPGPLSPGKTWVKCRSAKAWTGFLFVALRTVPAACATGCAQAKFLRI